MQTFDETCDVLEFVAAVTPMTVEAHTAKAWHMVLGPNATVKECQEAIGALIQRQTFVSPSEILQEVRAARKERLAGSNLDLAVPVDAQGQPIDPDDAVAYREALQARRTAVITGQTDRSAELARLLDGGRRRALPGEVTR